MTSLPPIPHGSDVEKRIVGRLVTDILAAGFSITVWNGGDEPELVDCTDPARIFAELAASDQDDLTLEDANGYAGIIRLVWGNDFHIISDYSVRLESVLAGAEQLADDFENGITPLARDTTCKIAEAADKLKAAASKRYYTLLERSGDGLWAIAFGDYDREVVEQEQEDMLDSADENDVCTYKIICTGEDQASIDAKVAELNAEG